VFNLCLKLLVGLSLLVSIYCTNSNPIAKQDSLIGFYMETNNTAESDSSINLRITPTPLPLEIPSIIISPGDVDSMFVGPNYWYYRNIYSGQIVNYSIAYKGELISGTLQMPSEIDSVLCNQVFAPRDTDRLLSYDSLFRITWKPRSPNPQYLVWLNVSNNQYSFETRIVNDTFLTVKSKIVQDSGLTLAVFCVFALNQTSTLPGSKPDTVGQQIYIYHKLYGREYIARYHMHRP
jgi:hypothetical protein